MARPVIVGVGGSTDIPYHYRVTLPLRGLERAGLATIRANVISPRTMKLWRGVHIYLLHTCISWALTDELAALPDDALLVCDADDDVLALPVRVGQTQEAPGMVPREGELKSSYEQRVWVAFVTRAWPMRDALRDWHTLDPGGLAVSVHEQQFVRDAYRFVTTCDTLAEAQKRMAQRTEYAALQHSYRSADLVTVSTPTLSNAYAHLNEHRVVLPNSIDMRLPCYQAPVQPHDGIVLGWAGTSSHQDDMRMIRGVLVDLLERYDQLHLMLGGPLNLLELFAGAPGIDDLIDRARAHVAGVKSLYRSTRIVSGRYIYQTYTSNVDATPWMYAGVDVGIVPNVLTDPINQSKSDLKGLELAAMGIPCVASPIPAYVEHRKGNDSGCVVLPDNEPSSWFDALAELIENTEMRQRMAVQARVYAETRTIDRMAPVYFDTYMSAARRLGLSWAR